MKFLYIVLAALPLSMACKCVAPVCPTTQPEKCECENKAAIRCHKACGNSGTPFQQDCSSIRPSAQICGSRGLDACPADRPYCINTPEQIAAGCFTAGDCPGFCVALGELCGGFAGVECPAGQTCADDPTDDCDPVNCSSSAGRCADFGAGLGGSEEDDA